MEWPIRAGHCLIVGPGLGPGPEKKTSPLRNRHVGKTGPQEMKTLPFDSCHMNNNVKVIHFYKKSSGVQSFVFVKKTFEKSTKNSYFESGVVGIKTLIANFSSY